MGACDSSGNSSVQLPNVLRNSLLLKAKRLHDAQDQWAPPPGVMLTQVVGLGIPTVRRIRYFIDPECKCMSHKLDTTNYGDGTVVSGSAGALPSTAAVKTFYFDMGAFNAGPGDVKEHSTMLGAAPLQTFIRNLVLGKSDPTQGVPFISLATPRLQTVVNRITLKSPAELHAYDLSGRHTGPIANDTNFNLSAKDQNIPNSI